MIKSKVGVLGAMFILRILGSGLSEDWGAETSPSSGYNHMHRHLLSGSTGRKKKECSYGNLFPWRDSVFGYSRLH
jgi:hypothetical protein